MFKKTPAVIKKCGRSFVFETMYESYLFWLAIFSTLCFIPASNCIIAQSPSSSKYEANTIKNVVQLLSSFRVAKSVNATARPPRIIIIVANVYHPLLTISSLLIRLLFKVIPSECVSEFFPSKGVPQKGHSLN